MILVNALVSSANWRVFSVSSQSSCFILSNSCFLCTSSYATTSSPRCRAQTAQSAQEVNSLRLYLAAKSHRPPDSAQCLPGSWLLLHVELLILVSCKRELRGPSLRGACQLLVQEQCRGHCFPIHPLLTTATADVTWTQHCTHSGFSGNLHKFFVPFICSVIVQALTV